MNYLWEGTQETIPADASGDVNWKAERQGWKREFYLTISLGTF